MAKQVKVPCLVLLLMSLVILSSSHHQHSTHLQSSQSQSLENILLLLNFTQQLHNTASNDFCNFEPSSSLTVACYEDDITQLHIIGNNGAPPLPDYVSTTSLFTSLATLPNLKVLSLVSLGLKGKLPPTIAQLTSLEILNVSSNYFEGSIPVHVSALRSLQSLILDYNKFTGNVPVWLASLPLLSVLSLKNNSLSGSLPNSITSLDTLRVLVLSSNQLSGELPDLQSLNNLQVLDLGENNFGPHFPNLPQKLVTLVLRNNRFKFGIPEELGSFYQLQELDVSFNGLVGPFSPSILALPSIKSLNIAGNKLTGLLYDNTSCSVELAFADISSNLLSGDLPTCLQPKSNKRVALFSRNCLSTREQEQHPSNFCHNEAMAVKILPHEHKEKKPYGKTVLASTTIGGIFGGIAVVGLVVLLVKRVYSKDAVNFVRTPSTRLILENVSTANTVKMLSDAKYISQTMKLGASLPAYRTFGLEEIKEATKNFDASSLIGASSFGEIYRGQLSDGTLTTIRSLEMRKRRSPYTYTHHIELVSKLRHTHLASALGHCFEYHQDDSSVCRIFLLFEFVSNGTLRDHISGLPKRTLTWTQRIAAAIGVVKGIQFLHTGIVPGVFSNKLKITDILMDQNLSVKISSCNLPLLAEKKDRVGALLSSSGLKENFQERAKNGDRNDVYNIGEILLEIILGRPITSQNEVLINKDVLKLSINDEKARRKVVDPAIQDECSDESLKTMMEICFRCLSNEPTDRPSLEDVLWNLQFTAQVQDQWIEESLDNQEDFVSSTHEEV